MNISRPLLLGLAALLPLVGSAGPIDPKALEPLQRMSAALAAAKAFTCQTKTILEVPAETGQAITLFSTGELALQRPNKLAARLAGDAPHYNFFYDGATVSAYAPGANVYSTAPAPGTIDVMLAGLQEETGIRFASAPLLFTDPYRVLTDRLESAIVVGSTTVGGTACTHLAFRSRGIDWEIWLEATPQALPRRLAVKFLGEDGTPRTLVDFSRWNLRPWLGAGAFAFHPPKGAKEIPYLAVLKTVDRR